MAAQKSSPYNALFYILQQQQFQKTAKHFVFSHFITTFARKYNDYSMVKKYDIPNDEPQMVSESMGELQARIEESTTQMENGDVVSGEDVYKSMRSFVNSLS